MWNWIVKTFGLKGSWKWAVKQMRAGHIIRPGSATGTVKYRLDREKQERICWNFNQVLTGSDYWESAKIFLSDFERTDWVIFV
jgi:hypothetical protein